MQSVLSNTRCMVFSTTIDLLYYTIGVHILHTTNTSTTHTISRNTLEIEIEREREKDRGEERERE